MAEAKSFQVGPFRGDVATMDPHGLFETMTLGFQANIYESLVIRDKDMMLVGNLATSWENIDPTTSGALPLRSGVKFHNGAMTSPPTTWPFRWSASAPKAPISRWWPA